MARGQTEQGGLTPLGTISLEIKPLSTSSLALELPSAGETPDAGTHHLLQVPLSGPGSTGGARSHLHLLKTSLTDECSFPSAPKGALLIWAAPGTVFQVIYKK